MVGAKDLGVFGTMDLGEGGVVFGRLIGYFFNIFKTLARFARSRYVAIKYGF